MGEPVSSQFRRLTRSRIFSRKNILDLFFLFLRMCSRRERKEEKDGGMDEERERKEGRKRTEQWCSANYVVSPATSTRAQQSSFIPCIVGKEERAWPIAEKFF